jgi:hypothetical protein
MNMHNEDVVTRPCDGCQQAAKGCIKATPDQNITLIDLNDDDLAETPEETVARQARYRKQLTERLLVRTHNLLLSPNHDNLELVLYALARYMQEKGERVKDKFVLYTWHKATCSECQVDEDGCIEVACDLCLEYMEGVRWMSPNFPVEQVNE